MKRTPIVAGNWKMNGTLSEAATLTQGLLQALKDCRQVEVVLCPPFTALAAVAQMIRDSRILLGAQNAHWEPKGALTGEISAPMLKEIGCAYCIIGHSERRQIFGETDATVRKRVRAVLDQGLKPILCVGETLEERQAGKTWEVVERQLRGGLEGVEATVAAEQLVIAYEPVWAIGTGRNATSAQAQEVHAKIRSWLKGQYGAATAEKVRIQYGGSVKPDNAAELLAQEDVDGALVGGASLDAKSFFSIVSAALSKEGSKCSTA